MPTYHHDGLTFDYRDQGQGDPVILLHGFPQDSSCWDEVATGLNVAGLRTLAPDQRGYSPGANPHARSEYRMRHLRGDVVALMDHLRLERAHVVGHDWGGGVAWDLAMRLPERVSSLVVLSTPHPSAMGWAMRNSRQWWLSNYMYFFQLPWIPERMAAGQLERTLRKSGLNAAAAAKYAKRFADPRSLTGPINWYRAISLSKEANAPMVDRMIKVCTTYVWGDRDAYLGREAAMRTASYVDACYRFIELDESHWLPEEAPQDVVDAIVQRVDSVRGDR